MKCKKLAGNQNQFYRSVMKALLGVLRKNFFLTYNKKKNPSP